MSETTNQYPDPQVVLLDQLTNEHSRLKAQHTELKALVEQARSEVERLQQKNTLVTNRLHHIESNFDSVPRQDIRVAYSEAMDTRNRLLTLRGNLEKLESDYEQMKKTSGFLANVIDQIQGIAPSSFKSESVSTSVEVTPAAATIIRIIEAQEAERQRLARQMHDGPAQSLTNFILQAEICQRLFDRNPDRAGEELNNLKTVASSTFQKVRDFIFDLRPMMLDDLGLLPTIRRYVENFGEKAELKTTLHILGDERRLESHREVIMFRSIQELLANARDHASASQLNITLDMGSETITCVVEDNGKGFDADHFFSDDETSEGAKALGLKTMRERLELIGGTLQVESDEGQGTRITIRIPAGQPPR
jgi:two-component system sensor histidine kinase DegS